MPGHSDSDNEYPAAAIAPVASAATVAIPGAIGPQAVISLGGTATVNYAVTSSMAPGMRLSFLTTAASTIAHNVGGAPAGSSPFLNTSGANITGAAGKCFSFIFDGASLVQD